MSTMHARLRTLAPIALTLAALGLTGCNPPPRDSYQQWVARDAWDSGCAEQGMIERWTVQNARWKIEGQVYVIDVDATFKLANACKSGLTLDGIDVKELLEKGGGAITRSYKQFENVEFKKTVEMSKCEKNGKTGWSLPGKESTRCWTGPSLLEK
jgi:hypothetical protein